MRKVIVMTAILALTACGQESNDKIQSAKAASEPTVVQAPVAQWALKITEGQRATITDTTGRLLDNGFSTYISESEGVKHFLIGPFATKAQAEEAQARMKLKPKLDGIETSVVELPAAN
ncbi:MAG: SPOR domain-containing protein [Pseudomonadota bacterium]